MKNQLERKQKVTYNALAQLSIGRMRQISSKKLPHQLPIDSKQKHIKKNSKVGSKKDKQQQQQIFNQTISSISPRAKDMIQAKFNTISQQIENQSKEFYQLASQLRQHMQRQTYHMQRQTYHMQRPTYHMQRPTSHMQRPTSHMQRQANGLNNLAYEIRKMRTTMSPPPPKIVPNLFAYMKRSPSKPKSISIQRFRQNKQERENEKNKMVQNLLLRNPQDIILGENQKSRKDLYLGQYMNIERPVNKIYIKFNKQKRRNVALTIIKKNEEIYENQTKNEKIANIYRGRTITEPPRRK